MNAKLWVEIAIKVQILVKFGQNVPIYSTFKPNKHETRADNDIYVNPGMPWHEKRRNTRNSFTI